MKRARGPMGGGTHRELLAELASAVRYRRQQLNLTVRELAERSGLSERFVGMVERGVGNPALTRLADLAEALGCSISELIGDGDVVSSRGSPSRPRPLVALLGLRGAGKTSVGRVLARKLRCPFVELDQRVEEEGGLKLGEIFALHGEDYYRRLEVQALEKLIAEGRQMVVATGGGVVTNRDAMALLRRHAMTFWLRAPVQAHWERVVAQGDKRPMAGNPRARAELDVIYHQRAPLYAQADHVVDTARLAVDDVAAELMGRMRPPSGATVSWAG
ncbi:MAG: shikimate kinase [Myxococcota bacterium]